MSEEFTLEELKRMLLNEEQPLGMDELLLLLSDYIGDEDIGSCINSYVDEWYRMFDKYIKMDRTLNKVKELTMEGLERENGKGLDWKQ